MKPTKDFRYWTWRHAVRRVQWCVDQHWYALLGTLFDPRREVL